MTGTELVRQIARRCRLSRAQAARVLDTILGCITTSLCDGRRSDVRGLGTFSVRSYRAYRSRNPKTGEPVEVAPKRLPYFKASVTLLRKMNEGLRGDSGNLGVGKKEPRPSLSPVLRESSGPNDFA